MTKKPALGRGLSALLENDQTDVSASKNPGEISTALGSIAEISVNSITANPFQPRTHFDEQALLELAQSIKELGIIQPITVRKMGYDKYQLISGERRFRASQIAGLERLPAYIRLANDQSMLEMALVENIQRSNLDAIEVAISYQRLIEECKLTQEELSSRVGKQRSTISNYLRLLKLPASIQSAIRNQEISMGHARALINLSSEAEQLELLQQILTEKLSVRNTEELAKNKKPAGKNHPSAVLPLSLVDKKLKKDIADHFKVPVKFQRKSVDSGRIVLSFNTEEDLQRILRLLDLG